MTLTFIVSRNGDFRSSVLARGWNDYGLTYPCAEHGTGCFERRYLGLFFAALNKPRILFFLDHRGASTAKSRRRKDIEIHSQRRCRVLSIQREAAQPAPVVRRHAPRPNPIRFR